MHVSVLFQVAQVTQCLCLSDDQLHEIMRIMDDQMNKGLGKETNASASIKMFPTYVRHLPDGSGKDITLI